MRQLLQTLDNHPVETLMSFGIVLLLATLVVLATKHCRQMNRRSKSQKASSTNYFKGI
jgi:hypothetical protein